MNPICSSEFLIEESQNLLGGLVTINTDSLQSEAKGLVNIKFIQIRQLAHLYYQ